MEKQSSILRLDTMIERLPMLDLALGLEHYDPNSLVYMYPLRPVSLSDSDHGFNLRRLSKFAAVRGRVWINDTPIQMLRLVCNYREYSRDPETISRQSQLTLQSVNSNWVLPTSSTPDGRLMLEIWDSSGLLISANTLCQSARRALKSGELVITRYPISSSPTIDITGPLFAQCQTPANSETVITPQRSYIPSLPHHICSKERSYKICVNTVARQTLRRFEAIELHPASDKGDVVIIHHGSVRVFSVEKPNNHNLEETLVVSRAKQGDIVIFERGKAWGLLNEHPELVDYSVLNTASQQVAI
jgi:hypothetical protein